MVRRKDKAMTVSQLMEILQDLDPDTEVRLATQPSWPFEHELAEVGITDDVVYLAEGSQVGYLPSAIADGLGWS